MSTVGRLNELEAAGQPVRFIPRLHGNEAELRRVSVAPKIHEWLHASVKTQRQKAFRAAVRAHLGRFVKGESVDHKTYMKRVSHRGIYGDDFSDEIWSIRPLHDPQHRFFGAFAMPDWFVVIRMMPRSQLNAGDEPWHAQIFKCRVAWDGMFPGHDVFPGPLSLII